MESMFLLIPIVVAFAIAAVLVFRWAVNNGQYDDLDREAGQVLFDEENSSPQPAHENHPVGASPRARPGQAQGPAPTKPDHSG